MKQLFLLLTVIVQVTFSFCQSTRQLVKDFDGDSKKDTIYIDSDEKRLVCILSTNEYKERRSLPMQILNFGNTLVATPKGFEFWNNFNRSEYGNEFQYNTVLKKMQLIKMTRIESVGEINGKSTINLLTNEYEGDFKFSKNYIAGARTQNTYKNLAKISTKMEFPQTFIDTFSDLINYEYEKKCIAILDKAIEAIE